MVPYSIMQRLHYMDWPITRSEQVVFLIAVPENGLHFRWLQGSKFF